MIRPAGGQRGSVLPLPVFLAIAAAVIQQTGAALAVTIWPEVRRFGIANVHRPKPNTRQASAEVITLWCARQCPRQASNLQDRLLQSQTVGDSRQVPDDRAAQLDPSQNGSIDSRHLPARSRP